MEYPQTNYIILLNKFSKKFDEIPLTCVPMRLTDNKSALSHVWQHQFDADP